MVRLKKILSIASILAVALITSGWSTGFVRDAHAANKRFYFMMQNMFSMNHPVTVAVQDFVQDVKKESEGRIKIHVLAAGAVAKGPDIFKAVGKGSLDMGTTCSCYHGDILPVAATAFALPGDPRGVKEMMDFIYQEETMAFIQDAYATRDVRYGAPMLWDGYTIVSKKPIKTWEDLKKMKVRASGSIAKILQKMDIPTVFIPFSEIYVALSRGTIDAEISGSHTESFLAQTYEVAKYQTVPEISGAQSCEIIMNKDRWEELPADLQTILSAAFKKCAERVVEIFDEENKIARDKMTAAGTRFIKLPDDVMDKWMKIAVSLWDENLAKESRLSARYIRLVKKNLENLGYNL